MCTRAGEPLQPSTLSTLVQALGVPSIAARAAAIRQYVLDTPAPIVAAALGYHQVTTARLAGEAGTTWSNYAPATTAGSQRDADLHPSGKTPKVLANAATAGDIRVLLLDTNPHKQGVPQGCPDSLQIIDTGYPVNGRSRPRSSVGKQRGDRGHVGRVGCRHDLLLVSRRWPAGFRRLPSYLPVVVRSARSHDCKAHWPNQMESRDDSRRVAADLPRRFLCGELATVEYAVSPVISRAV